MNGEYGRVGRGSEVRGVLGKEGDMSLVEKVRGANELEGDGEGDGMVVETMDQRK